MVNGSQQRERCVLVRKLKERLRDHGRDELCADLRALGIQAQISERGRPEEKITHGRGKSFGIIDIQDVLIRWVDVKKQADGENPGPPYYHIEYGVPGSRITSGFHKVKLE